MSLIRWLHVFLSIENIFGVYRNYSNYNKIKKCLVIIQIFVLNLLYFQEIIDGVYSLIKLTSTYNEIIEFGIFGILSFISSWVSVVLGITRSHTFVSYLMSVTRVYESIKCDREIIYSFKSTYHWLSLTIFVSSCSFGVVVTILDAINTDLFWKHFFPIFNAVSEYMWRSTMVLEHYMLFIVVMTIVDLSKTLISLMVETQQRVHRCGTSEVITRETINRWVELYQELVNCCDKVAVCFGGQYIFSLACTTAHYISVVYFFIYFNVLKAQEFYGQFKQWFMIVGYVLIMSLPIVASQMASNQCAKCQRVMARLHNSMIEDARTTERKMIKDFLRVIKKHPLHIRFMPKVPVGIFLLPAILTLVVNYVIVLLQFNHVV